MNVGLKSRFPISAACPQRFVKGWTNSWIVKKAEHIQLVSLGHVQAWCETCYYCVWALVFVHCPRPLNTCVEAAGKRVCIRADHSSNATSGTSFLYKLFVMNVTPLSSRLKFPLNRCSELNDTRPWQPASDERAELDEVCKHKPTRAFHRGPYAAFITPRHAMTVVWRMFSRVSVMPGELTQNLKTL